MTQGKRKKILFLGPLPPPLTGAGLRNKSLMESPLIQASFQIELIPFNFASAVEDIGRFSFTKIFKAFARAGTIIRKILTYRPDLVYFNVSLYGFALYRDFGYVLIFKLFGCKLLYHLRTQGVKAQSEQSRWKRWMFAMIFKNTRIVCLSEYLSKDITGVYRGRPIIVNNGIKDMGPKYVRQRKDATVRIFFMAHLWVFKGVLELIEALSMLKSERLSFDAVIAGPEGDLVITDLKRKLATLDLADRVDVPGPVEGDVKNQMFRDSDIFVLPTTFEGFPGAVLEAMQFGLPVVATVEGAIPEIVDDNRTGLLVKKKDARDLADKLRLLILDAGKRQDFGKSGRSKFEEKYSLGLFEKNMQRVFAEVMEEKDIQPKLAR